MRPYLAIIKDSFRAALASRVLYVLLGIITLLLVALAPFHYRESLDWKLRYEQHLQQVKLISQQIYDRRQDPKHPEMIRIWDQLPSGLKKDLATYVGGEASETPRSPQRTKRSGSPGLQREQEFRAYREVFGSLNEMIQDANFYRADDWTEIRFNKEAKEMRASLDERFQQQYSRRLNRLLIGEALRPHLAPGNQTSLAAHYGPWPLQFLDFQTTRAQFGQFVAGYIPGILDKFVLSIGLAIAILVTASIIPETFEPGSLNLLLSKPISRSLLFLAKFVGGCVFITLCATYLFFGIWLWLGLAFGVWEKAILFSIVLYVIVFAIYYSVSSLVGLVFRSTIMSIVVTLLFWGGCFSIGLLHGVLNTRVINTRVIQVQKIGDSIVATDRVSGVTRWDRTSQSWVSIAEAPDDQQAQMGLAIVSYMGDLDDFPPPFGPLVNPIDGQIVAGRVAANPLAFSQQPMLMASSDKAMLTPKGEFPLATTAFFQGPTSLIAVATSGKFYRFKQLREVKKESKPAPQGIFGSFTTKNKHFELIGPDEAIPVSDRNVVALNRTNGEIVIYSAKKLHVYAEVDGKYLFDRSIEVETNALDNMSCKLAYQGNTIVMVLGNGQVIVFDADTLKEKNGYRPETRDVISKVVASPNGRWFFLRYRNQKVWMIDTENDSAIVKAPFSGQGLISAVNCVSDNEVFVADRGNRVRTYRLPDFQPIDTFSPAGSFVDRAFWYAVRPLYQVWPKPGEFYKVVAYLSSSSDAASNQEVDLAMKPKYQNPFQPLTSGLIFMILVLFISCCYFTRKDY